MQTPLQVTFRHISASESIDAYVNRKIAKLERIFDRIVSCHVAIEAPSKHHAHGANYHVRVQIAVPGEVIEVSRSHEADSTRQDAYGAIDAAFDEAARQLIEHRKRRLPT
jgi:ribosomal subunit interface protein